MNKCKEEPLFADWIKRLRKKVSCSIPQRYLFEIVRLYYPNTELNYPIELPNNSDPRVYFIDIYIPKLRVCIEYDGIKYHSSKSRRERDKQRDKDLEELGYTVIRVNKYNCWFFITNIKQVIKRKISLPFTNIIP